MTDVQANEEEAAQGCLISETDRNLIKERLVELMISVEAHVQRQLGEAIAVIGRADFPDRWPSLMTQLTQQMAGDDLAKVSSCLYVAEALFRCVTPIGYGSALECARAQTLPTPDQVDYAVEGDQVCARRVRAASAHVARACDDGGKGGQRHGRQDGIDAGVELSPSHCAGVYCVYTTVCHATCCARRCITV